MNPQALDAPGTTMPAALGADLVLRTLEAEGIEACFGMPGGAILPIYDAIARGTSIRHVLVRHEQGAGDMAQGYAGAKGRPAVVFATSGPGATNLVTPIADAAMDSTPLICVTGQVRSALIGTDAFQECDIVSVVSPLVKGAWLVRDVEDLGAILREAVRLACDGRPGPVLVDIPRDVQEAPVSAPVADPPARPRPTPPDAGALAAAATLLAGAERPILYVGGGAVNARATDTVLALVEAAALPVVTTLMAKGAVPEDHALFFGWPGMHGTLYANLALNRADVVVAVGARFDDRVTGRLDRFAEGAAVVHLDVDPPEVGKLRRVEVGLVGPLGAALDGLRAALGARPPTTEAWLGQLRSWRRQQPLRYDTASPRLKPHAVLERLDERLRDRDVVYTTGVGQHQMWAMQYLTCRRPRSFITSGGHGTMGFGLPAALGSQIARPGATVVCVDGDGSFLMTLQELATGAAERLGVVVVILDNRRLGMVNQWQTMFYEERRSAVDVGARTTRRSPAGSARSASR